MTSTAKQPPLVELDAATVRFCGDSGDGMQLAGGQLTNTSALHGNDVATFPDYPAEIRAPRGTKAGVSGFQIHFSSREIFTPGDQVDCLIAMNAAALVTNLEDLKPGGVLVANSDGFRSRDLKLAGCEDNPLETLDLSSYKVFEVDMTKLTRLAVQESGLTNKEADRCRNFYAMGFVYWLYDRSLEPTERFIIEKFGRRPAVAEANQAALKAGYNYGVTIEASVSRYKVDPAKLAPGTYRNITGNQSLAWGLLAAAEMSNKDVFYGTYPITPASDILHELARRKNFGVRTFQAEDEIAAMAAVVGAAFAGSMAVTGTSGPGIALKAEAMGLAMMTELPMLVINVQRAGPSTGLPTKTEQADLFQAIYGRHGECPMPVLAAKSPGDCFEVAYEAWRIAANFMTPVMILSDAYVANGSEPWRIPEMSELKPIPISHPGPSEDGTPYRAYERDERLSRPWALPGTPGLMHRTGGLEKQEGSGIVSYDPDNHERMIELRAEKIANVAKEIPEQTVEGPEQGELLLVSWGGTYGAIATAATQMRQEGVSVAHAHLRHVYPFPLNLGDLLRKYKKVLVPELNKGQLCTVLRSEYLVDAKSLSKMTGRPFQIHEIVSAIQEHTSN